MAFITHHTTATSSNTTPSAISTLTQRREDLP